VRSCDVLIIGGGAAGLWCAIEAGRRGRSVILLDHAPKIGRKILISGGGRCNFTNVHVAPDKYLSNNPHFCKSALARYTPADFIGEIDAHGIAYHEKTLGQLFCDQSAKLIVAMLLAECAKAGVEILTSCSISAVDSRERFSVATTHGEFRAPRLVIATGGLSIPSIGATDLGYRIARDFHVPLVPTEPALVPLLLPAQGRYGEFSGMSLPAQVSCGNGSFIESILFTHGGLSGPAILQASSYWQKGMPVHIDLQPGSDVAALLLKAKSAYPRTLVSNLLMDCLPKRLAQRWFADGSFQRPIAQLSHTQIQAIAQSIHAWVVEPTGSEGYAKAEVTRGGVDTDALSSQSMEVRAVPGLYFIGEVVDVTGWLGGYNFHWAWASGHAAGTSM
jgi:predicted Rossmann fold flavoprotein